MAQVNLWGVAIPSWIAALGTVMTSGVSVGLAIVERNRAKSAEEERDGLREAVEAGVASRVAGWLVSTPEEPQDRRRFQFDRPASWRALVRNASDQVITEVRAYAVHSDGGQINLMGKWPVVPPMETLHEDHVGEIHGYNETPYLRLVFTDPAGRRWVRGEGQPRIATEDDERVTPY